MNSHSHTNPNSGQKKGQNGRDSMDSNNCSTNGILIIAAGTSSGSPPGNETCDSCDSCDSYHDHSEICEYDSSGHGGFAYEVNDSDSENSGNEGVEETEAEEEEEYERVKERERETKIERTRAKDKEKEKEKVVLAANASATMAVAALVAASPEKVPNMAPQSAVVSLAASPEKMKKEGKEEMLNLPIIVDTDTASVSISAFVPAASVKIEERGEIGDREDIEESKGVCLGVADASQSSGVEALEAQIQFLTKQHLASRSIVLRLQAENSHTQRLQQGKFEIQRAISLYHSDLS